MAIISEKFSNAKLSHLQQVLNADAEEGQPRDYEIWVDDLKVIQRTNNPERFDSYEDFINADTKNVTILLYEKSSRRNTKFIFTLKEAEPKSNVPTLDGIENTINEKLEQEKKNWQFEVIVKERAELEKELENAEAYIDKLENDLAFAKSNKYKFGDVHLGDIVSVAMEGIVKRNPHWIAKIPGAEGLAGTIMQENRGLGQIPETISETQVSFKKVNTEDNEHLSEADQEGIKFMNHLRAKFTHEDFINAVDILNIFCDHQHLIKLTLDILKSEIVKPHTNPQKKAA